MKTLQSLLLAATVALTTSVHAADKIPAGPNGGRLLSATPNAVEFLVKPDRTIAIGFFDASMKPVATAAQVVNVTAETKTGRVPVQLEKTSSGFVSKQPLPEGEPYRVVVQVRENAEAKPQNFRVQYNMANCAECSRPEYACTCGH